MKDLFAQQYHFQVFNYEQGLSSNDIVKIIQDRRGHLWFASMGGGIYRFNGKTFENYTEKDGLGDNDVGLIVELPDGRLLILSLNSFSIYDGKKFTNFTSKDGILLPGRWASTALDNKGRLWIALWNADDRRQLLYFEGDRFHDISHSYPFLNVAETMLLSVVRNSAGDVVVNTQNKLYVITDTVLFESTVYKDSALAGKWLNFIYGASDSTSYFSTYEPSSHQYSIFSYKNKKIKFLDLPGNIFYWFFSGICEDDDHNIWIPSETGIWRVNRDGSVFLFDEKNGLPINLVFYITKDNENNLWLATRGLGAVAYMGEKFITINEKDGLNSSRVYFNFKDSKENIWFATSIDKLCRFDGTKIIVYDAPEGREAMGFFETGEGKTIALTYHGLFDAGHFEGRQINSEFGLDKDMIPRVAFNDGTNIWFVNDYNTLIRFDGKKTICFGTDDYGKETGTIDFIVRDTNNNIWFATNAGFMTYDGSQFTFTNYPGNCLSPDDMTVDKWNRVWIAVYGGLIKIDETGPHLYSTKQGLSSDRYLALAADGKEKLYAGFSNGFDIITFKNNGSIATIKSFSKKNGFSAYMLSGQNINIDSAGNIWFATMQGLIKFNPGDVRLNSKPPETYITGIKLFYKEINWESEDYINYCDSVSYWFRLPVNLCLPYDQNHLTFEFGGVCFSNPNATRYQWKLEGLENDWSPVTEETKAEYPNLPPGEYTFMVKSCNNDGLWNEKPAEFHFIIKPPIWRTWWFLTLALILGTGILAAVIRFIMYQKYRKKINELARLQEIEKIRTTLSKDIHDGTGASLSKIALLSESLKAEIDGNISSLNKLNQISGLSRRVIDDFREIIWSTNPRYDNLAALMAYSRIYCNDLFENSGIDCILDFPDNVNDSPISPLKRQSFFLILKEAAHNIIKHSSATACTIEIEVTPQHVSLKVKDNGKGFDKTNIGSFSNGLGNMAKRAHACQGKLEIESVPGNGTAVLLDIPL
ncbi:MAG TPA: triple tyrosine motif-containing protein [Bacteroidales bacterium]|nr:triple tyrosine motif-containing protein [Bacteroidales bacterium]